MFPLVGFYYHNTNMAAATLSNVSASTDLNILFNESSMGSFINSSRRRHPTNQNPYDYVQRILNEFLLPTICICGILGNTLIIVVMTRHRVRRTVSTPEMVVHAGLLTMAISDLMFNISLLPRAFISESSLLHPAGSFTLVYNSYATGFITMFSLTSTWLIVVTSGLRYVGVCHPLRARYVISPTAIYVSIGIIITLCVIGNLPQFWLHTTIHLGLFDGVPMVLIDMGSFSHIHHRGVIYSWVRAFFSIFIPGVLLIYFNTRLLMALRASRRLHQSHVRRSTANTRHESGNSNKLTRTLIAVILMFIILVYPSELIDFFTHIAPVMDIRDNQSVILGRAFTNILQVSNFSFNFILYCAMNAPFRMAVQELACSRCTVHRVAHFFNITVCCQRRQYSLSKSSSEEDLRKSTFSASTTQTRLFQKHSTDRMDSTQI